MMGFLVGVGFGAVVMVCLLALGRSRALDDLKASRWNWKLVGMGKMPVQQAEALDREMGIL